jgi:hypothetical protein
MRAMINAYSTALAALSSLRNLDKRLIGYPQDACNWSTFHLEYVPCR